MTGSGILGDNELQHFHCAAGKPIESESHTLAEFKPLGSGQLIFFATRHVDDLWRVTLCGCQFIPDQLFKLDGIPPSAIAIEFGRLGSEHVLFGRVTGKHANCPVGGDENEGSLLTREFTQDLIIQRQ